MSGTDPDRGPIPFADDPTADPALRDLFAAARRDRPAVGASLVAGAVLGVGPRATAWPKIGLVGLAVLALALGASVLVAPAAPTTDDPPVGPHPVAEPAEAEAPLPVVLPAAPTEPSAPEVREPAREHRVRAPVIAAASEAPEAAPPTSPAAPAVETAEDDVADEVAEGVILLRARRALAASDPVAALVAVGEHEARFPNGRLTPEREAIAISALVAAGRPAEARPRATRFLERWPSSAYADRARRALEP